VTRSIAATMLWTVLMLGLLARVAEAQQSLAGIDNIVAGHSEQVGTDVESHYRFVGDVEMTLGDAMLYADLVEVFLEKDLMVATGNVTLVQTTNRISAERAEFNYKTKLGTFWGAYGFATIKPQAPRPGAFAAPPVSSQDTDVYFQGEVVEKIGGRKYRITKGGFTTCVQPTPRWQLTSDTIILNIEHYTFLRNAIFSVKGVPMLYTPVMYYPTKKDDRATGFLIPTLGETTLRGESIHNAFFWVLDRSEDLTFMHDWFSKTGQGLGSEYRYNYGGASNGNLKAYFLNQHNATYTLDDGTTYTQAASHSYEVHGNATQFFPFGIRARGRVDYFSSITENQSFNMNYLNAYTNQRSYGGNAIGAWGTYSMNATVDHTQWFSNATTSATTGSWPTISFNRNERLIPGTPLYFSAGAQYAGLLRSGEDTDHPDLDYNQDVTRLDVSPQIRFPFKKWQWFTVNSTLAWRDTFYTRSLATDPETNTKVTVDKSLDRRFFTMQAQMVGPVFNRIWDTPDNSYAEKFKHTVEPFLNIVRTTAIDNFDRIILIDGTDYIVGGNTQMTYGVNNRFYAKQPGIGGQRSQPREILDVSITQSHYSQSQASQYDIQYTTSSNTIAPSNFSPILITVRAMPTNEFNAQSSIEIDSRYLALRQVSAGGGYSWAGRIQTNVNWSKRAFIAQLDGFNDPANLTQAISAQTNVHTRDNHFGGIYSFNYDVLQGTMLNQRMSAFYNSQCCGIAFEYQTFNFGGVTQSLASNLGVTSDHRFFISFTLAGLGNFSPFNGAMSGIPR
jgi:lipopolysaccharide assembly outer membrane protein LptD (OstA)